MKKLQKAFAVAIIAAVLLGGCSSSAPSIYITDTGLEPGYDGKPATLQKPPASLRKKSHVELPVDSFQHQEQMMMHYYQTVLPPMPR